MIEYKKEYHDNGQLYLKYSFQEDELHGVTECWYKDGRPNFKHTFQKGKRHGLARGWYPNGQKHYELSRQEGKLHGVSKGWHEAGHLEYTHYHLYDDQVTEEEYRRHEIIEKLSGL